MALRDGHPIPAEACKASRIGAWQKANARPREVLQSDINWDGALIRSKLADVT